MDESAISPIPTTRPAKERWTRLIMNMPNELQSSWHSARLAMGITRALMLLEDTQRYFSHPAFHEMAEGEPEG